MRLSLNDIVTESIFGVWGRDENALTAALCMCLTKSETFELERDHFRRYLPCRGRLSSPEACGQLVCHCW
jgi:hypothetical protein